MSASAAEQQTRGLATRLATTERLLSRLDPDLARLDSQLPADATRLRAERDRLVAASLVLVADCQAPRSAVPFAGAAPSGSVCGAVSSGRRRVASLHPPAHVVQGDESWRPCCHWPQPASTTGQRSAPVGLRCCIAGAGLPCRLRAWRGKSGEYWQPCCHGLAVSTARCLAPTRRRYEGVVAMPP